MSQEQSGPENGQNFQAYQGEPVPTGAQAPVEAAGPYDHLVGPYANISDAAEAGAVRPATEVNSVKRETERQMGIAAADRKNREAAKLPPRTYDLR